MMIPTDNLSQSWFFLQQESFLIASCLGNGLTSIRQAASKGKGEWYSAFFQLSIGIERLMKSIIIVDHINRGQLQVLTPTVLKNTYGHDLLRLLKGVEQLKVSTTPNPVSTISNASTDYQILGFLNDFAKVARYHNIDGLTATPSGTDPLTTWNDILKQVFSEDVPQKRQEQFIAEAKQTASTMSPGSIVLAHGLDKSSLTMQKLIRNPLLQDEASGYVVCHLLNVLRPLEACLSDLTHASYGLTGETVQVPDMCGHLIFLREKNSSNIRKRKRWP